MNRIIVIGNGFDLAHGIKSGYKDFIDTTWNIIHETVFSTYFQHIKQHYGVMNDLTPYRDIFVDIEIKQGKTTIPDEFPPSLQGDSPYCNLYRLVQEHNERKDTEKTAHIKFKNKFFGHISQQCSLMNWLDIENEYYEALKRILLDEDSKKKNENVKILNNEFGAIKKLLEAYLNHIIENTEIEKYQSIQNVFSSLIELDDIANGKQKTFLDSILCEMDRFDDAIGLDEEIAADPSYQIYSKKEAYRHYVLEKLKNDKYRKSYCTPNSTLILNFNYTKTAEKLYAESDYEVINIHGELNNRDNPLIFGYGDELDDDYKTIEKLQDNDFLENIKSIQYHKTQNYRELLKFIESDPYQVFIMGHSCGNSDRTLLNTLFEHENCVSLKVFYRQFEDGSDDYSNLIRNISRNFNDKPRMRDIVVNWERCSPLVPISKS